MFDLHLKKTDMHDLPTKFEFFWNSLQKAIAMIGRA